MEHQHHPNPTVARFGQNSHPSSKVIPVTSSSPSAPQMFAIPAPHTTNSTNEAGRLHAHDRSIPRGDPKL
jgi:hypothetical protein